MLRLFLSFALLLAAILLLRRLFSASLRALREQAAAPPPRLNARMVKCAYCEVYVPEDTAITLPDKTYCSEAHRDADSKPT